MIESSERILHQAEFRNRITRLRRRMQQAEIERTVIYSDEYHFENMAYLCGYRPVFEMALLVVKTEGDSLLITGHEGKTLAQMNAYDCKILPYGPFSAQGMGQEKSRDLTSILKEEGLKESKQVGIVGPRFFLESDFPDAGIQHAVPGFILQAISKAVGKPDLLRNATGWLTHLPGGLRSIKSAFEIALLEEAGTRASRGVIAMMEAIRPGMRERELLGYAQADVPSATFSYAPVLHSGSERCNAGLLSPSERSMNLNDPVVLYYSPSVEGYSGNSGRSGILAARPEFETTGPGRGIDRLFGTTYQSYLSLIKNIRIGANVKKLVGEAMDRLRSEGLEAFYMPLHTTGLTEWEGAFDPGDATLCLESGTVFQVDFTVFSPKFAAGPAKIEDGFTIAEPALLEELESIAPVSARRIHSRRTALEKAGISMHPSVLPLSDLTGQFYPYLLGAGYRALTED